MRRRRRPGTNRSTACGRRRRTRCAARRARRAPAKNSSVSACAMRHCSRRGVLHLVQQQVIEAAVQLVQHPGRAGIDQQRRTCGRSGRRSRAARTLPCARRRRAAPARRASAARRRPRPRAAPAGVDRRDDAVAFVEEAARQIGMRVASPPWTRTGLRARGLPSLVRNSSHQSAQCSPRSAASRPSQSEDRVRALGAPSWRRAAARSAPPRAARSPPASSPRRAMIAASVAAVTPSARRCAASRSIAKRRSASCSRGRSRCSVATCRPN